LNTLSFLLYWPTLSAWLWRFVRLWLLITQLCSDSEFLL